MYGLGVFMFSDYIFWPFGAKMYLLARFYSQRVHFGQCGRKCTSCPFVPLLQYIWAILRGKIAAGVVLLSAGTFRPFRANLSRLGNVSSESLHFGHFGQKRTVSEFCMLSRWFLGYFWQKCTCWQLFIVMGYNLAIVGENVPLGRFILSSGTFGPFCKEK